MNFIKDCRRRTSISELMDGGRLLKTEHEILTYVQNYYHKLYTNDQEVEDNVYGWSLCLLSVPTVVTENIRLISPFDELEVGRAIKEVPKHKRRVMTLSRQNCFMKCRSLSVLRSRILFVTLWSRDVLRQVLSMG